MVTGCATWEMLPMAKRVRCRCVVRTMGRLQVRCFQKGLLGNVGFGGPQENHGSALPTECMMET